MGALSRVVDVPILCSLLPKLRSFYPSTNSIVNALLPGSNAMVKLCSDPRYGSKTYGVETWKVGSGLTAFSLML